MTEWVVMPTFHNNELSPALSGFPSCLASVQTSLAVCVVETLARGNTVVRGNTEEIQWPP